MTFPGVRPACAGIHRCPAISRHQGCRQPRERGDPSRVDQCARRLLQFAPRPACLPRRMGDKSFWLGGIFVVLGSAPRARGSIAPLRVRNYAEWIAPRTRGWVLEMMANQRPWLVCPASVGMCRRCRS